MHVGKMSLEVMFARNHVLIFKCIFLILDVLAGYNGTIFAYGQTASGKTHTMEVSFIHVSITALLSQKKDRQKEVGNLINVEVGFRILFGSQHCTSQAVFRFSRGYFRSF